MGSAPVLVVEDECELAKTLCAHLHAEGFSTEWLTRGDSVSGWLEHNQAALILLDQTLPGKQGLDICKEVRSHSDLPIIMVSTRIDIIDRLLGLESGADDYICKPFNPREVVARVKTVLRRAGPTTHLGHTGKAVLRFDDQAWQVTLAGQDLQLTSIEYQLLFLLAATPGRLYTRSQIIDAMYVDNHEVTDRTIDSHIRKIRRKFDSLIVGFDPIQTVYGVGYSFTGREIVLINQTSKNKRVMSV